MVEQNMISEKQNMWEINTVGKIHVYSMSTKVGEQYVILWINLMSINSFESNLDHLHTKLKRYYKWKNIICADPE